MLASRITSGRSGSGDPAVDTPIEHLQSVIGTVTATGCANDMSDADADQLLARIDGVLPELVHLRDAVDARG